eukprot:CAMPEP_0198684124 /NCGR_PEP_ID=MMETSP1468-20131203/11745_1 /TAXON_ID=1461545 /ORGANISM="Mantoniella sp, Strain CCMP1436" /LENGTH=214 /DNA_ID=CAMNT_0044428713 /DNA_START=80 /DNA_END=724 /DNA_ORIENTATION=-
MALYTREASQINALRTVNAKHKHMEMLLLDRLQANAETYPHLAPKQATDATRSAPEAFGAAPLLPVEDEDDARLSYDPNDPVYWLPPYEHGGQGAREQSRMVSSRRTPSGNFFNMTNPSLHLDRVPSTDKPRAEYKVGIDTMIAAKHAVAAAEIKTARDAKNADIDAVIAAKKGAVSDIPVWATASQLGDRKGGGKQAKLISSKRTPNGGFFQP